MRRIFVLLFLLQAASLDLAWGMSNPASDFCIKNGGKLEIRTSPGRKIEEWAYYRAHHRKRPE
jgi:putative hemolysin